MTFLRHIGGHVVPVIAVAIALLISLVTSVGYAQEKTAAIAQGFQTREASLTTGALVSIELNNGNYVELASSDNAERLVGVVGEKALIELTDNAQQTQIITSGVAPVLVSDINGEVKNGDKIAPSPVSGVGMKATESGMVLGTAQANLSNSKPLTRSIKTKDGTNQSVKVAVIPAQVSVANYVDPSDERSFLPEPLQIFANSVAGREVSPIRVAIAALVMLLALVSIAALLYSAVRSSIISIGRNPLSEVAVRKSLWQVGLTVAGILLLTLIAIYLILIT